MSCSSIKLGWLLSLVFGLSSLLSAQDQEYRPFVKEDHWRLNWSPTAAINPFPELKLGTSYHTGNHIIWMDVSYIEKRLEPDFVSRGIDLEARYNWIFARNNFHLFSAGGGIEYQYIDARYPEFYSRFNNSFFQQINQNSDINRFAASLSVDWTIMASRLLYIHTTLGYRAYSQMRESRLDVPRDALLVEDQDVLDFFDQPMYMNIRLSLRLDREDNR